MRGAWRTFSLLLPCVQEAACATSAKAVTSSSQSGRACTCSLALAQLQVPAAVVQMN